MKKQFIILALLSLFQFTLFGQSDKSLIEEYVTKIDSLYNHGILEAKEYSNMSYCGGHLIGYYINSELVFLKSVYSAELGYSSKTAYFKDSSIAKIIYKEHFAEWDKHAKNYPTEATSGNYENMTYSDTTYYVYFADKIIVNQYSMEKLISENINYNLTSNLINCCNSMVFELNGDMEKAILEIKKNSTKEFFEIIEE
mgnify:CR=1 FL=1